MLFNLYLLCLVTGGLLIAVTLFTGGDDAAEADLGGDVDTDVDFDGDVDVDADMDADFHGDAPDAGHAVEGLRFLSLRNIIFFVAIFGLTGTLLSLLGTIQLITLPLAIVMGGAAASVQHRLLNYLLGSQVGETTSVDSLVGHKAIVLIDIARGQRGKIRLDSQGQTLQLLADLSDTAGKEHFSVGDEVLIVEVARQIALVAEENYI
ncbi:MAG TPA: DUF1449 family protein [Calditrichia bacterium]|nr:DUF1449 family protein [Calditrichia bacterium]